MVFDKGGDMRRLPESELEIMMIIWDANKEVSRVDIQEELNKTKNLATTTILSFLSRLVNKGFLKVEKRKRINYYYPLVSHDEYVEKESKNMLERFFNNSIKNFVVQLNDCKAIDKEQFKELKDFVNNLDIENE